MGKSSPEAGTSDPRNLRLGFHTLCLHPSRMKTQDAEQALATHVAQDYTQRECGDRRAKNHQHTYFILHNGPSIQSDGGRRCVDYALCIQAVANKSEFPRIIRLSL
jgi:hypothetical protein